MYRPKRIGHKCGICPTFFLVERENRSNQIMLIVYTIFYVLEQMRFFPFIAPYNAYILSALIGRHRIFPVN